MVVIGCLSLPVAGVAQQASDQDQDAQKTEGNGKRVRRLRDSLAVDPDKEWVPGLERRDRGREIERKLSLGEQALAAGKLIEPPNDNALEFFQAVLEINPDHQGANQGLEQVLAALLEQAEASAAADDRAKTTRLLAVVRRIQPDHPRMAVLETRLARDRQLSDLLQRARQQIDAHQLVAPADASALASLEAVIELDAGNITARKLLVEIQSLLIADVRVAADGEDFEQAFALLDQAESIPTTSEQVAVARSEVAASQQRSWQFQADDIATIIGVGQLDLAAEDLQTLAASGYTGPRLDELRRQLTEARILRDYPAGSTFSDPLGDGAGNGPTMMVIDKGRFAIGSPASERGRKEKEGPQQQIVFEQSFALALTETTVGQFRQFVEATGYQTDVEKGGASTFYDMADGSVKKILGISWRRDYENKSADDRLPVIHVSWNDASAYADWLATTTGKAYRLPSEAEFEYSLKAGSTTAYWWGKGTPKQKVENLTGERDGNDGPWQWPNGFRRYGDGFWGPAPVASFKPNPNGLHDMGGNVMEWVADCYRSTLEGIPLTGIARTDGNCELHPIRGASWASQLELARSAYRSSARAGRSASIIGFRVARDL